MGCTLSYLAFLTGHPPTGDPAAHADRAHPEAGRQDGGGAHPHRRGARDRPQGGRARTVAPVCVLPAAVLPTRRGGGALNPPVGRAVERSLFLDRQARLESAREARPGAFSFPRQTGGAEERSLFLDGQAAAPSLLPATALKPIGFTWSWLDHRIGYLVPIWQCPDPSARRNGKPFLFLDRQAHHWKPIGYTRS
jgi:hypothetical protein